MTTISRVHRISPAAQLALARICQQESKKPAEVLNELIVDYWRGLDFDNPKHPGEVEK